MAENIENNGCSQRDNAEHEGYVKASRSFNRIWKERDSAQPRLLEAILYKDNFNRAYKRVKANKGAPGIDGMTIEEALPYLKAVSYTHLDVYKRQVLILCGSNHYSYGRLQRRIRQYDRDCGNNR